MVVWFKRWVRVYRLYKRYSHMVNVQIAEMNTKHPEFKKGAPYRFSDHIICYPLTKLDRYKKVFNLIYGTVKPQPKGFEHYAEDNEKEN